MGSVEKRWSSQSRKDLRIIPKKIHMITWNLVRNILKMESIGFAKKKMKTVVKETETKIASCFLA